MVGVDKFLLDDVDMTYSSADTDAVDALVAVLDTGTSFIGAQRCTPHSRPHSWLRRRSVNAVCLRVWLCVIVAEQDFRRSD
jgi:hypothetical protein